MSPAARKRVTCEFAVAILVCGALRFFFIAPIESRAEQLRLETDRIQQQHTSPLSLSAQDVHAAEQAAVTRFERVRARSRLACNQTELLSTLTDLANQSGLSLDQFEPGRITHESEPTPAVAAPPSTEGRPADEPAPRPTVTALESHIQVSGPFESVARFLDLLAARAGFTIVKSVQLDPTGQPGVIRANITAEHLGFAVPDAPRSQP